MPAGISLKIRVDSRPLRDEIDSFRAKRVPAWRRRTADIVTREALWRTIIHNPVDTARSRSAWVTSLKQLGGVPPTGWRGADPESAAIAEGTERSHLDSRESSRQSERRATNAVHYVVFLEFGTSSMVPFRMVQRSLMSVRLLLGRFVPPLTIEDAD